MLVETIKLLARQHSLSIRKLERELGFGNGTIPNWSKAQPTVDKLKAVADYFGVSIDYLLGTQLDPAPDNVQLSGKDAQNSSANVQDPAGSDQAAYESRLVDASRQLNTEGKVKLLDYALDLGASGRYQASNPEDLAAYEARFQKDTTRQEQTA